MLYPITAKDSFTDIPKDMRQKATSEKWVRRVFEVNKKNQCENVDKLLVTPKEEIKRRKKKSKNQGLEQKTV